MNTPYSSIDLGVAPVESQVRKVIVEVVQLEVRLLFVVHIISKHMLSVAAFGVDAKDRIIG